MNGGKYRDSLTFKVLRIGDRQVVKPKQDIHSLFSKAHETLRHRTLKEFKNQKTEKESVLILRLAMQSAKVKSTVGRARLDTGRTASKMESIMTSRKKRHTLFPFFFPD